MWDHNAVLEFIDSRAVSGTMVADMKYVPPGPNTNPNVQTKKALEFNQGPRSHELSRKITRFPSRQAGPLIGLVRRTVRDKSQAIDFVLVLDLFQDTTPRLQQSKLQVC